MSHKEITGVSPRHAVVLELSDTLLCAGLNEVYGIVRSKGKNKNGKEYRSITFCRARTLDGVIEVYSPYFIIVKWLRGGVRGHEKFTGAEDVKRFIIKEFM
jgi:hypothetical protein